MDASTSGGSSGEARRKEDLEAAEIDACGPLGDTGSYLCHSSSDIDAIRPHLPALEMATQEDRRTLQRQLRIITQQKTTIAQKTAANARLEARLASAEVALQAKERELLKCQGHADTLRVLSAAELTGLAESLVEALLRIQREHQRKFSKQSDEQLCVVCLSERKEIVLRPCNHLTMCTRCFEKCNNICPQCCTQATGHLKIYL